MVPSWVAKYIGIPFVALGRDFTGCDCYGLLRLVLLEEDGFELPLLSGRYADACDPKAVAPLFDQYLPILGGDPLPFPELKAAAVIRIAGRHAHLGMYVGDGLILHSRDDRNGSLLEHIESTFFRGRIERYYRVH